MSRWHRIAPLHELPPPAARGYELGDGEWPVSGVVVRTDAGLSAWVNRCPHAGHPLNMLPHRFLTRDGRRLLCASHGAVFEPHSGLCTHGPCPGERLTPMAVSVDEDGWVCVRLGQAAHGDSA